MMATPKFKIALVVAAGLAGTLYGLRRKEPSKTTDHITNLSAVATEAMAARTLTASRQTLDDMETIAERYSYRPEEIFNGAKRELEQNNTLVRISAIAAAVACSRRLPVSVRLGASATAFAATFLALEDSSSAARQTRRFLAEQN